jgi:phytoene dehydrogenase-like protein
VLLARYRDAGGELRMRSGVARILFDASGAANRVELDDGTQIVSDCILSSAGWPETMALCGQEVPATDSGQLSFVESVHVLDRRCDALGHGATITFFNTTDRFRWRRPDGLVDVESGVLCCSDNYASHTPSREGLVRVTSLADHDRWCALDEEAYRAAKVAENERILDAMVPFGFDPRPHRIDGDMFTPRTIRQYTGRLQGAVYGSPRKRRHGETGVQNLHLIGTDQGLVGVVGALLSGVTMANQHVLRRASVRSS